MGFYDQSVMDAKGSEISMRDYEGKVVLVVNTATGCGFTPQYKELEEMYEKFHEMRRSTSSASFTTIHSSRR